MWFFIWAARGNPLVAQMFLPCPLGVVRLYGTMSH